MKYHVVWRRITIGLLVFLLLLLLILVIIIAELLFRSLLFLFDYYMIT